MSDAERVSVSRQGLEALLEAVRAAWYQRDSEFCVGTAEFAESAAELDALVAGLDVLSEEASEVSE